MLILLTNDDGIYAPGLAALARQLRRLGQVYVVAPATEQSGVAHSITYLRPLTVKEVYQGTERWGWAVDGSPADCVKMGVDQFCPRRPDLVVSGMNLGLNAGINVLYSGTVAAAIEGAFYGITSIAVSLQYDEHADFDKAAAVAVQVIRQVLEQKGPEPELYNLNIPTEALHSRLPQVRIVPMDVAAHNDRFERRLTPWGRPYYWIIGQPQGPSPEKETDLSALAKGYITLTPLEYDLTKQAELERMRSWRFELSPQEACSSQPDASLPPSGQ
ncbi:MAG: 5'/3'-nucleotidase SurE [Thermoguttaceae bacterium]|nr:5'/3'-nucleotidase SurE [Thermoguttaceae bacterium]MDW8036413.1 5'/3'-nucleotidase SurE [Thermoguttaceae bacterium]